MTARRVRVAVLDDYQEVASVCADWSTLPNAVEVTIFSDHLDFGPELIARLEPFDVVCAMRERTPFPRQLLERLPHLRLLVTTGRRNAAIDLAAATELGITVCGTGSPGHATAELTLALMLALARNLIAEQQSVGTGGWQVGLGRDLRGARLGIIGLGRLGAAVARLAAGFGMEISAWSENLTDERCRHVGVQLIERETLLRESDFISIHLRLSQRTTGLIGSAELALIKPTAYLINTSRGGIVDEEALIYALESGTLAGAALDVYTTEPLPPDHPLRSTPGLLTTPHIGYVTRETYEVFYAETVEAIAAFLGGAPVRVLTPS